jgi:hypothetical protein
MILGALLAAAALAPAPPARAPGACPIPRGWQAAPAGEAWRSEVANWIGVARGGALVWNGMPVETVIAAQYLDIAEGFTPRPLLVLTNAPGASCAELAEAAAYLRRHYSCAAAGCLVTNAPDRSARPD